MTDSRPTKQRGRADWRLLLFSGLLLPVLIALGIWQLHRAAEKQALLDRWQHQAETLDWSGLLASEPEPGQPVRITGLYGDQSWLLDNRTRDGRPGYEVITAFFPLEGPPVLVNRGWLPAPARRDRLPEVQTPAGIVTLAGRLAHYPEPPVLADTGPEASGWPRRVQRLPRAQAEQQVPGLAPLLVRLDGDDQPGAFRADWAPDLMAPGTHYGYAVQWFALALALTILTVVASYRTTGADNDNDNG
ncbi:SURF1 family protein [Marinobacter lutaoensis]|jgi:cytochrome oxidase assembly protein ShyY1|uniref:SURF1-like protein n=1 Tax=Marinobacter lutaoensis TaxID=135739 RepID=A0A1V2DVN0_9GAMM|nr:SURF1 family protein [Marinobacter lutaoensis]MBI43962.1 SURF1 family protein [Oceanospirillales bacterium]ONF44436.1 hypothetical protein BTO32_05485 [Marinobacter lutaoensis]